MPDPNVARWQQQGRVYLWHYRNASPHWSRWQFTADAAGSASLLRLLGLMQEAEYPARQTIRISDPTPDVLAVPNYRQGDARWQSASVLEVRYPKGQVEPEYWKLSANADQLRLVVGAEQLVALTEAVRNVQAGRGDFAIGPEEQEEAMLYVWWHLDASMAR